MRQPRETVQFWRRSAAVIASFLLLPGQLVFAGGPLVVGGSTEGLSGIALVWDNSKPISYRVDSGPLSQLPNGGGVVIDNAHALTRVQNMFANWSAVPAANLSITQCGWPSRRGYFSCQW